MDLNNLCVELRNSKVIDFAAKKITHLNKNVNNNKDNNIVTLRKSPKDRYIMHIKINYMGSDWDVYGRYIDDFGGYVITLDYEGFFAALNLEREVVYVCQTDKSENMNLNLLVPTVLIGYYEEHKESLRDLVK